jgi:hypothetical protein
MLYNQNYKELKEFPGFLPIAQDVVSKKSEIKYGT